MSAAYTPTDFTPLNDAALTREEEGLAAYVERQAPLVEEAGRAAGLLAQDLARAREGLRLARAERARRTNA